MIYVVNSYDFEDGKALARSAREAVPCIAALLGRARQACVPVVYVNDNYGAWNASSDGLVTITHLLLTGQVTEQCLLYSALDAYIRRFAVAVATDAVAHIDDGLAEGAAHDGAQHGR